MRYQSKFRETFTKFLIEDKGCPPAAPRPQLAFRDQASKRTLRPDLVIVDRGTNRVAAVIEFKAQLDPTNEASARQQVLADRDALSEALATSYVVYPDSAQDAQTTFRIFEVYDADNANAR